MQDFPYNRYNDFLQKKFLEKVYKITVDAGFTCPNRDGKIGTEGCSYCDNAAFNPNQRMPKMPIQEQILLGRTALQKKRGDKARKFIVYFQSYTNTYASPLVLREKYEQAFVDDSIVGIAIGTRPDCLPEEILDVLEELSKKIYVSLEIGVQTSKDKTLLRLHRGHDFKTFTDAVIRSRKRNLEVCTHVILGLPGETRLDMLDTAKALSLMDIQGVKIHSLSVCKNTLLEKEYLNGDFRLLEEKEYVETVCDFIQLLRPDILIHRLATQTPPDLLVAPLWVLKKMAVQNAIIKELEKRNSWQGKKWK